MISTTENSPAAKGGAPAVTRALAILRLLGRSDDVLGVNAIAKRLDLVPSTCLHILRALAADGFVRMDPVSKAYSLDAGLLPLAYRLMRQDDFSQRAGPLLQELTTEFGVTTVGVRVTGLRHMVVLALAQPEALFRLQIDVGSHFPALISATGRCNAAFGDYDSVEVEAAFGQLIWDRPPAYGAWRKQVAETRKLGYSIDSGSYIQGVTIVAAPVFDGDGRMSHGLAAVGLSERLSPAKRRTLGKALRQAGYSLSLGAPAGNAGMVSGR